MNNICSVFHTSPRPSRLVTPSSALPLPLSSSNSTTMPAPKDGAESTPYHAGKRDNTALQAHVAFFDPDGDGIIWPLDTFRGFRDLGFGLILSVLSMFIIHGGFSWVTFGTLLPDPFFRLNIKNMHRGRHGSDTASYTATGQFDEDRFNYVFNMYSSKPHTSLTFTEGVRMLYGNREAFDFFGWFAATFEWLATYLMLWPEDGRLKKEDVRAVYDGSIFYKVSGRKMNH
ncbi:putative peroxygenase 3 [Hypsizygus marmoreus]|uniref:Peroxygenase 3 n=1 Tax=Hypsizygus marmoreus TaxID=39966 RepID=A0A369JRW6_HYPMA|nr:putative peroxygenase 3 [Hypsizygus marmoreus]